MSELPIPPLPSDTQPLLADQAAPHQQCPQCHADLERPTLLCPACGAELSPAQAPARQAALPRTGLRRALLLLLAFLFLVGTLSAAAYAGIYYGERDRAAQRQATLDSHYQAGLQALNAGQYERARAEFKYVLQLEPQNALAKQGLDEAEIRLAAKPTPTLEVVQSLSEQLLAEATAAYAAQDWVTAARTLTQLRGLDPDYEQQKVEEMLFPSLYHAGMDFLAQDRLEEGISYLDQAIALRPLDVDAVNARNLAARYLDALGYWGVDWETCIAKLIALNRDAPGYRDVTQRIYQAYLAYGDFWTSQGELCPAERAYTQALLLFSDPQVDEKRSTAAQTCLLATPTPVSGTVAFLTPQPIAGFTSGRLAYPVYNSATGAYDLYALYADGRVLQVAANADQPWWEWGTGRVIYRDKANGGLTMELPEEGVPLRLLAPDGQAWPALSPDGRRIAYAAAAADGVWSIYITNVDGTGTPRRLANGWAPAWGRTGQLAYTGCEADGTTCGIFIDNPDDAAAGVRLTGSENDIAVSWAPAGNLLAYMTNVTGNWDILTLSPSGGVAQVTYDASDEGLPAWSPDGSRIAFVSNRGGPWAIYIMTPDGQNMQQVVSLGSELPNWTNQRLSWAP